MESVVDTRTLTPDTTAQWSASGVRETIRPRELSPQILQYYQRRPSNAAKA